VKNEIPAIRGRRTRKTPQDGGRTGSEDQHGRAWKVYRLDGMMTAEEFFEWANDRRTPAKNPRYEGEGKVVEMPSAGENGHDAVLDRGPTVGG